MYERLALNWLFTNFTAFHAVQTFVGETQMVQISKNEAFIVLSSRTQIKLKKQFCNI